MGMKKIFSNEDAVYLVPFLAIFVGAIFAMMLCDCGMADHIKSMFYSPPAQTAEPPTLNR